MNWVEGIGYLGTALTVSASAMSTMIPLRIVSLVASAVVIAYGLMIGSMPVVFTEAIQIPFNAYRLWQMMRLVRDVEIAIEGDLSLDWLRPYGSERRFAAGTSLFGQGDAASAMYYVESGCFRIPEYGIDVRAGGIVGELGLLSPGNRRTASLICTEAGRALEIPYSAVKQLYYQNPEFGFSFLKLTSERLFQSAATTGANRAVPAGGDVM